VERLAAWRETRLNRFRDRAGVAELRQRRRQVRKGLRRPTEFED
jgi:hypothetical protein